MEIERMEVYGFRLIRKGSNKFVNYRNSIKDVFDDKTTYLSRLPKDLHKLVYDYMRGKISLMKGLYLFDANRKKYYQYEGHVLIKDSYDFMAYISYFPNYIFFDSKERAIYDFRFVFDGRTINLENPFVNINHDNLYIKQQSLCNVV